MALLQALPSSQLPSLPKFNSGAALPTRCTNYSVLPNRTFGKYTVVDTLVGRAEPELNLGKLGDWLDGEAQRSILWKVHAAFGRFILRLGLNGSGDSDAVFSFL